MTSFQNCFYVNSYPRSGNTWVREMLHATLGCRLADANPVFHRTQAGPVLAGYPKIDFGNDEASTSLMIKSHGRYHYCRDSVPILYLVRDGRDSLYSYYHYNIDHRGYTESWHEFFYRYVVGQKARDERERTLLKFMGRWDENCQSYRGQSNVRIYRYEHLLEDPRGALEDMLRSVGALEISPGQIESAVAAGESKLAEKRKTHDRPRGRPALWRQVYSKAQKEAFWLQYGDTLDQLGYPKD